MNEYSKSPDAGENCPRHYVDMETGEVVQISIKRDDPEGRAQQGTVLVNLPTKGGETANIAYPFKWMAVFLPAFERIIKADLTKRESHVLYEMLKEVQYGNRIDVPHWIIADNLGIDRANVSKAIKKLVDAEILQRVPDPDDRGRSIYLLNNIVGWRGKSSDWHRARERGNVIQADFRRNKAASKRP